MRRTDVEYVDEPLAELEGSLLQASVVGGPWAGWLEMVRQARARLSERLEPYSGPPVLARPIVLDNRDRAALRELVRLGIQEREGMTATQELFRQMGIEDTVLGYYQGLLRRLEETAQT